MTSDTEIPTPGQIIYDAFNAARYPRPSTFRDVFIPWEEIGPEAKHAWEAAAQVLLSLSSQRKETI